MKRSIDVTDRADLDDWSKRLGVSAEQLMSVVDKVGSESGTVSANINWAYQPIRSARRPATVTRSHRPGHRS